MWIHTLKLKNEEIRRRDQVLDKASAEDLLSPDRLDIMARLDFAESRIRGIYNPWASRLYRSFLTASEPSGKFVEDNGKLSIEDYEFQYLRLIDSLNLRGFDSEISRVPVGPGGITNGAHRVAVSLALGIPVGIEPSDDLQASHLGYKGLLASGLSQDQVEYMVWRYVQNKKNTRVLIFSNVSRQAIEKSIFTLRSLLTNRELYSTELFLSDIGKRRILKLSYGHLDWWSDSLVEKLVAERHLGTQKRNYLVLFQVERLGQEQEIKEALREELDKSLGFEWQIHGSDNHFETLRLLEPLLNRNSRLFLNLSPLGSENRILAEVVACGFTPQPEINQEWSIDGSSTLELFGIRMARDIDYVSVTNLSPRVSRADLHNAEYLARPTSLEDIIFDPRKHMRVEGVKFISLPTLVEQKISRGEKKDNHDISQVAHLLSSGTSFDPADTAAHSQRAWRTRVWVGRKLEKFLKALPRKLEPTIRQTLRVLGSMVWRE